MAIKTSNQITFTEQKKILEIKEWYLATSQSENITIESDGWTEEVQTINKTNKYLWNYEEVIYSIGSSDISEPVIIGFYGKGEDGKSILNIKNYYQITTDTTVPTSWLESVPMIDSINKYLWNYEVITYTVGDPTETEPAIIGVYGDSGTDAVDFQIYSVDGFEFDDNLTSIELKTIAFQNGKIIDQDMATYQWLWWNHGSTLSDKYEDISGATSSILTVNVTDSYALTSLKCKMTYDGIVYEDYVSLIKKTDVYTAAVKFFNGNNVITNGNDYIIVYVELYKNNTPEEQLCTDKVYVSDANVVRNNIITTDISGTYTNGDLMYFVYQKTYNSVVEYDVVLGQYVSGKWKVIANNYIYNNNLFPHSTSNVVFIPKEKIPRSLNVSFDIYNDDTIVARTNTIVLDLNDPIVSNIAPTDPKEGQLWLDMSISPSILKMWDGGKWVNSGYQNGNIVYTSKPIDGYSKGDLWILSEDDEDLFGELCAGTMLKATVTSMIFDKSHWVDADEELTSQKKNIKQYFLFNKDTGLRIGQTDDKFYVNISSTRMSFCENPLVKSSLTEEIIDPNEVVSISNQSAKIKNLTVEDDASFNCEVHFWNLVLVKESNGSFSLSVK